jgi:S1-C subfamily serine protease
MPMQEGAARSTSTSTERSPAESRLGMSVAMVTPDLASQYGLDEGTGGLVVTSVDPLGPTGRKGIAPGMRLLEVAGHHVETQRQLADALEGEQSGHAITLRLADASGRRRLVNVRLQ